MNKLIESIKDKMPTKKPALDASEAVDDAEMAEAGGGGNQGEDGNGSNLHDISDDELVKEVVTRGLEDHVSKHSANVHNDETEQDSHSREVSA